MTSKTYSVSDKTAQFIDCLKTATQLHTMLLDTEIGNGTNSEYERVLIELMQPVFDHIENAIMGRLSNVASGQTNEI